MRKSCGEQRIRRLLHIVAISAVAVSLAATSGVAARRGTPRFADWQAVASLRGAEVVPPPGDPDGQGAAEVRAGASDNEVCFGAEVSNVALPAVASHLHEGLPGQIGPVVLTLAAPDDGVVSGCIAADAAVLAAIGARPGDFYVDIHTAEFPDGAVRGQLGPAGPATGPDTPTIVPDAPSSGVMPETGRRGEHMLLLGGAALVLLAAGAALLGWGRLR